MSPSIGCEVGSCEVKRDSQTVMSLREQDVLISALEVQLNNLTDRLGIVLMPDCPPPVSPGMNKETEQIVWVDLANNIRQYTRRLRQISNSIDSIFSRIEL
jgi:hypothetical protein